MAAFGYHYEFASWTQYLLPAALLSGAYLITLAGVIAGAFWWVRRKEIGTRWLASRLLRWPFVAELMLGLTTLIISWTSTGGSAAIDACLWSPHDAFCRRDQNPVGFSPRSCRDIRFDRVDHLAAASAVD